MLMWPSAQMSYNEDKKVNTSSTDGRFVNIGGGKGCSRVVRRGSIHMEGKNKLLLV